MGTVIRVARTKIKPVLYNRVINLRNNPNHHLASWVIMMQPTACLGYTTFRWCSNESSSPAKDSARVHEMYKTLSQSVTRLEQASTVYGYSLLRVGTVILIITAVGIFFFRDVIRENVVGEVSTVATKTLSDENLQQKTQEITIDLLHTVFQSKDIQREAVRFLEEVLQHQETQDALKSLLLRVLSQPETLAQLSRLLKDLIKQSLSDDKFRSELASNIKLLLSDDSTKQAVLELLQFVLNDPEILETTKDFVQQVLVSYRIQQEAKNLGKTVLDGVVSDIDLQKHTGDALWRVVQHAITPSPSQWFSSGNKDEKNTANQITQQQIKGDGQMQDKTPTDLNDGTSERENVNSVKPEQE